MSELAHDRRADENGTASRFLPTRLPDVSVVVTVHGAWVLAASGLRPRTRPVQLSVRSGRRRTPAGGSSSLRRAAAAALETCADGFTFGN